MTVEWLADQSTLFEEFLERDDCMTEMSPGSVVYQSALWWLIDDPVYNKSMDALFGAREDTASGKSAHELYLALVQLIPQVDLM